MGVAHLQGGSLTGVSEEKRKGQLTQALLFFKVRACAGKRGRERQRG
jgi:hypothetical protein